MAAGGRLGYRLDIDDAPASHFEALWAGVQAAAEGGDSLEVSIAVGDELVRRNGSAWQPDIDKLTSLATMHCVDLWHLADSELTLLMLAPNGRCAGRSESTQVKIAGRILAHRQTPDSA